MLLIIFIFHSDVSHQKAEYQASIFSGNSNDNAFIYSV